MMRKIFDQIVGGESQFFFALFQSPITEIKSLIDSLEVDESTFLKDLIINFMYEAYDNPFIDTIMSVPTSGLLDGISPKRQLEYIGGIINDWLANVDLSELTNPLREIVHEFNLNGMYIEPIDASISGATLLVEFEAFLSEYSDEDNG